MRARQVTHAFGFMRMAEGLSGLGGTIKVTSFLTGTAAQACPISIAAAKRVAGREALLRLSGLFFRRTSVMKIVGIEEHALTPGVRDAWYAIGLEACDPSVAFHAASIERRLLDIADERLALMDETGLDVQVLSITTPALHDLGPDSVDLAKRTNDLMAAAVAAHPARFQALAMPITTGRSSEGSRSRTWIGRRSSRRRAMAG